MSKYESPDYKVILNDDPFEIREYIDFFIIEYDDNNDPEIESGFGSLFSYISSDNKEKEKISMTVPVIEEISQGKKKMAFVVPSKFGDKIPEPNNANLSVRKFNKGLFGVIKYSGFSNTKKEIKMQKKLSEWIKENGYTTQSNYMLAFYNAPFTPPMLRRNEVWVRIIKE
ncbi:MULTISPECIES: heme-binding protein [unclassified Fusibacter]|uniref:SOUL family heme-binding protein n=1 Tax=unclassified Fusibacter TaxID=2624464 RepID=UPI0010114659|nr:heme-binding protein [Fusibacter sp. A1]MCK8060614.1 heme-binding protein [Fusibacter sp. A2]NPE22932.1 heme-binding protein [Fusibacter sp. A1]RXV59999.1 heme-binding protein [Fusibacter sp. A1]